MGHRTVQHARGFWQRAGLIVLLVALFLCAAPTGRVSGNWVVVKK
ncbi:MAG TPA: hypothetical protein VIK33_19855 [Anaerolineae bacterium]